MPFPAALVDHEGNYPWTDGVSYPEATPHNIHLNSIDALEEKVGIDDSADTDSFDYMLKNLVETAYVRVIDSKAYNVDGQSISSGSWVTRELTDIEDDDESLASSLSGNAFTLAAGTYRAKIWCPVHITDQFISRLYNVTDTAVLLNGVTGNGSATSANTLPGWVVGQFTIAAAKSIRLETYTTDDGQTGENHGISGTNNIYTVIELFRRGL